MWLSAQVKLWFVKQNKILTKVASLPKPLLLCCKVSELRWRILSLITTWWVLTSSSSCQLTQKEEWCSLKHLWVGFVKAVVWVWAPSSHCAAHNPPQECRTSATAEDSEGRGEHRIHKCRLAKVIILHYLLPGPELSGTPLTVCCAQHTAPIHSTLPRFACEVETGQIHQSARSTDQGTAFVISSAGDFGEKNRQRFPYLWVSRRETKEQTQIIKQFTGEQEMGWEKMWAVK